MSNFRTRLARNATILAAATALIATPTIANAQPAESVATNDYAVTASGASAVKWFQNHKGSTGWEHYCEKAVENAWGTTGIWASANAHWNGAKNKHAGKTDAPKGAFVYWATASTAMSASPTVPAASGRPLSAARSAT